jgi:hypothetical protein
VKRHQHAPLYQQSKKIRPQELCGALEIYSRERNDSTAILLLLSSGGGGGAAALASCRGIFSQG